MPQTQLSILNGANQAVTVFVTLGASAGNITLAEIPFVTPVPGNTLQGSFSLAAGKTANVTPPAGKTVIGNVCFGGPPINCPAPGFPRAVNLFEFALNLAAGGQETIDISCVAGVNSQMKVALAGGGGWNAGSTRPSVTSFHNVAAGGNTGLVGVYPISCDVCTASQAPPRCTPAVPPEKPQSQPICNVQRDASASGGTVAVTFGGFV
jgi:hypothetical protein